MSTIDWLIVVTLNLGAVAYGLWLARGTHSSAEWFLGARALPWWAVGLSMFATNIDNADIVSLTGNAYHEGLHIITVHSLGSTVGGILAAFLVVPAIYRGGYFTNAEYLEARFGPATRVLSALIQIQYRTSMLGLMVWAVFLLLTGLVGLDQVSAWALIVSLVVLAALYTAWGGLRSVVLTDVVQGVVMLAGSTVIFVAAWNAAGGWDGMLDKLSLEDSGPLPAAMHPADLPHVGRYRGTDGATSPYIVALGWVIIAGGYWTVNHTQTMRLMGSRSLWDMRMAALLGVAVSLPIMLACASLGLFGRALFPGFEHPDDMYPHVANEYLGAGLRGLVVAGMLAAAISTFDSMGSALSALFTRDIYARLVRREGDDAHYLRVGRWATVGILALGFLYIPFIATKRKMLDAFLTLIPVLVTPLFTIYLAGVLSRAHRRSGAVGLTVGAAYGFIALFDREVRDVDWLPSWLTGRWEALPWSLLITGAAMLLTTVVLGREAAPARGATDTSGWLERSRQELPPLRRHPFARSLPGWLRPGLWAVALLAVALWLVFGAFW